MPITRSAAVSGLALWCAAMSASAQAAEPSGGAAAKPATSATAPAPAAQSTDSAALAKAAATVGYKPKQQDGHTVYCRRSQDADSRLNSTTCMTADQMVALVQRAKGNKDGVDELQRRMLNEHPNMQPGSNMMYH